LPSTPVFATLNADGGVKGMEHHALASFDKRLKAVVDAADD